jgi:hypothetical protein
MLLVQDLMWNLMVLKVNGDRLWVFILQSIEK